MTSITTLLAASRTADAEALNKLFAALYGELRQIAHAKIFRSGPMSSVDTTGLVHESYLRLLKAGELTLNDRSQFLAYASQVMRSVIVDAVRKRQAERHGGEVQHVTLNTDIADSIALPEDEVIRVNEALVELAAIDARLAQVVELRYFGGLRDDEIADLLAVNLRTVERDWEKARMFLYQFLLSK